MRAGTLRHRVALQSATETTSAMGQVERVWSTYATVYAAVQPKGGSEVESEDETRAERTWQVTIRYRDDVLPRHRLTWDGKTLDIAAVLPDSTNARHLVLDCLETV